MAARVGRLAIRWSAAGAAIGELIVRSDMSDYDLRLRRFVEESARDFAQFAGSPEEQRMALCWFLRRGAEEDFSQGELTDLLGVSSPCVLSLAGYSEEAAQRVMDMLGDITQDEIDTAKP
jgi:hypothetical protein